MFYLLFKGTKIKLMIQLFQESHKSNSTLTLHSHPFGDPINIPPPQSDHSVNPLSLIHI